MEAIPPKHEPPLKMSEPINALDFADEDSAPVEVRKRITLDESIDLLLWWTQSLLDYADELDGISPFKVRQRENLVGSIQERAQCIADLLCLLSGRSPE